ncbi:MAG: FlxA-like family protein [Pseudomonadota bacterium]
MAESISVDLRGVMNSSAGASASGAGSSSTIEGLKKKLISLQKDLKDAIAEQSKASLAKAKLIEMQIQVTQARLDQLIQEQAQRAMEASMNEKSNASFSTQISSVKKEGSHALGSNINVLV